MFGQVTKNILFFGILLLLLCNLAQDLLKINWQQKPLQGYFVAAPKDTFSIPEWFNGSYAEKMSAFVTETFGFHNFYVRLNNQLRFSLFNKANVKEVIVGKENFLYQQGYINEYNGTSFWGEWIINDSVQKLKQLQDVLASLGKNLLVVLAPNKARIYPEFLPGDLNRGPVKTCHYEAYKQAFLNNGINFIDFNKWYLRRKSASQELLIPQMGVHWSRMEGVRAADTIFKRLFAMGKVAGPAIRYENIILKDTLEPPDNDAIQSMNLLWQPSFIKMKYPLDVAVEGEKCKANLLVISDSYWWDIYDRHLPKKVFTNNEFWYYNKDAYGNLQLGKADVQSLDIQRHILRSDFVVIVCAESNLGRFGFGFITDALRALQKKFIPTAEEIDAYKREILSFPDWSNAIKEKARNLNLPPDSVMQTDILWMLEHKGPLMKELTIEDVIQQIKNDHVWFENIKTESKEKGINLDTLIRRHATYVFEQRRIPD